MSVKILTITLFLISFTLVSGQNNDSVNFVDSNGLKQGFWIKKYPGGAIMYKGTFINDKPDGEFTRFYENGMKMSFQVFSDNGKRAETTFYHKNGNISSKGVYIEQKKEGKWDYYSEYTQGYLISTEHYSNNKRNGLSVRLFPNGVIGESIVFENDLKTGPWIKNYENGNIMLRAAYKEGKLDGPYEFFNEDGTKLYSGSYSENLKNGKWIFYNSDGSLKYELTYTLGKATSMELEDESRKLIDSLDRNSGKIPDPELTGEIR